MRMTSGGKEVANRRDGACSYCAFRGNAMGSDPMVTNCHNKNGPAIRFQNSMK